jgi:hypothetical protein
VLASGRVEQASQPNTDVRRAAAPTRPAALLLFPLLPTLRVSFLRPIGPELLAIGPEVGDVLVVLDADKCHARARHFLHRRADIFGESFFAPGDAGRFIGWGVVETLEGAALAAIDAVERWALDLAPVLLPLPRHCRCVRILHLEPIRRPERKKPLL